MGNYVICPHCKKTISNNPVIEAAAAGGGSGSETIKCECGEMLTYWDLTAQLRGQKTIFAKLQTWWQTISKPQG